MVGPANGLKENEWYGQEGSRMLHDRGKKGQDSDWDVAYHTEGFMTARQDVDETFGAALPLMGMGIEMLVCM